jgi:hypothetical protein
MKKLISILIGLALVISVNAQFQNSGGMFLRTGSSFTTAQQPTTPPGPVNHVHNGTFDSDDGWSTYLVTIANGVATYSGTGSGRLQQFDVAAEGPMIALATNTQYRITFTVVSHNGGSGADMSFTNSNQTTTYVTWAFYNTGTHNLQFTTPASLDPNGLRIVFSGEYGGATEVVIDNVSITPVQ